MTAVSEEYGWKVHYEDPPYQGNHDLEVMNVSPEIARLHPGLVFRRIATGTFKSTYPEDVNIRSSPDEEGRVLDKIVSDYNHATNPGGFVVSRQPDGSYAVIGNAVRDDLGNTQPIEAMLDTRVSVATQTRTAAQTLDVIVQALSERRVDFKIGVGIYSDNLFVNSQVTVGGQNIPARTLLLQCINATRQQLAWRLLFDVNSRMYYLSVLGVARAEYDAFGGRKLIAVDSPRWNR